MTRTAICLGALALSAAACRVVDRGEYVRTREEYAAVTSASEMPLEASLRRFDEAAAAPDVEARLLAAGKVLEEARRLRDTLESGRVPVGLEYAGGEELIYANHLVDGFDLFVRSDGGPAALDTLRSILGRGRIHRDRGLTALMSARPS